MKKYASACLLVASFATFLIPAFVKAEDKVVTGTAKVKLQSVTAVLQNGNPDTNPRDIAVCKRQVSSPSSKYLGNTVSTSYSINTQSLIMSASSSLPSPHATQPLELTIPLNPLGIAGEYAFGAFKPTALPNTYVLFSVNKAFKDPQSSVLVLNDKQAFNCLVSSKPNAINGSLKAKYKVE
jgi:hypothetical protein